MIWQTLEVWEIIKIMEFAGFWSVISFVIWAVLFLPIPPIIGFQRDGYLKIGKGISFLILCWKRAGICLIGGYIVYFTMFICLFLHPEITIVAQ